MRSLVQDFKTAVRAIRQEMAEHASKQVCAYHAGYYLIRTR